MKLLGSTENIITKDKNGENVPHLEVTEVVKPFSSSLEISPKNHIFKKIFNSGFQAIEVWFTDQNGQPLEIDER